MPIRLIAAALATLPAVIPIAAKADEVFVGAYIHEVETPFTLRTDESGADIEFGYRFEPEAKLSFIGKPAPYLIASVNTEGDTSFAGAGLSWKLGGGPVWVRPGIGLVVHDGPSERYSPVDGKRIDLGSRVLFAPEIAVGTRLSGRLSVEASWVHISHARLFNWDQNPGIDMMGMRLTWRVGN
jgi:hypothetical protein